jgi:hypothetical protein
LSNKVPNAQVSDTTGDAKSKEVEPPKNFK